MSRPRRFGQVWEVAPRLADKHWFIDVWLKDAGNVSLDPRVAMALARAITEAIKDIDDAILDPDVESSR